MSIGVASFKHLKLTNSTKIRTCHYIANCSFLHDSYITEFDFMNYAFAMLLLVRLYFYGLIQFNSSEFQSSLSSDRSATQQVKCEVTFILQCICIINIWFWHMRSLGNKGVRALSD